MSDEFDRFRDKVFRRSPNIRTEYDRLGPRFAVISELIRARNRAAISQSELARRMNVTPNTVSRLESAVHSPRIDTIAAAADAMGYECRVSFVRRRKDPRKARPRP